MIDEARTVVMPLEFANADERAVTLAQYVNPD